MTDPLRLLALMTMGRGSGFHVQTHDWRGRDHTVWTPACDTERYCEAARFWLEHDLRVTACPYLDQGSYRLHGDCSALWARCETPDSYRRLCRFSPEPTVVLQEGRASRFVALWALTKPLCPEDAERANKRLAHRLFSPKKHAAPSFAFHPPGTVIRGGRKRPVVVTVVSQSEEIYGAGRVVRRLKDAPDPDAWKTRRTA